MAENAPGAREIFGRGLPVAVALASLALHGVPAAATLLQLVAALADPQNGRGSTLSSIKDDTSALRRAPFREAVRSLGDAWRLGPEDPLWPKCIRRAESRFSEALELASDTSEKALIEFNLGAVFLLLDHQANALHHFELSRRYASQTVDRYARTSSFVDLREPPRRMSRPAEVAVMAALLVVSIPLGLYAVCLLPRTLRHPRELRAFFDLYNLIERAWAAAGGGQARYIAVGKTPKRFMTAEADSFFFVERSARFPLAG
jgi:hypothetical protein